MGDDVRFKNHGLAPKSAADFAFLLHGFHFLKDEGVMAIIPPHGVLFRGGAEERIRTKLLKDGHIDTVIGLPANFFYSTGIPWLGQVPKHWEVKRLRFAVATLEQGWSPQCDNQPADDDCWGVMKVGCVNGDEFDPLENKALPPDLEPAIHYELKPRDILISRANTKELLGSAAIVPANVRPKLLLCDKLYRVTTPLEMDEEFLTCYLRTPAARFQYEREATGASNSMQNIGQDTIKNLVVTLPPLEEQKLICQAIRKSVLKLDNLMTATQSAIDRLTEYRTALITAATTGKIDVRGVKVLARDHD